MHPRALLKEFSPVVVGQEKDEEKAGEAGDGEKDPEKEVVHLLGKNLPVLEDLIDLVVLFLLLRHHLQDSV